MRRLTAQYLLFSSVGYKKHGYLCMTPRQPPHLPPKSCNIKLHSRIVALPGIFLVLGISVLAGFAAALMTFAWIVPPLSDTSGGTVRESGFGNDATRLDAAVMSIAEQRIVNIFEATGSSGESNYTEDAFVGQAALLSSDGWSVLRFPAYYAGREKKWTAIDAQGTVYRVEAAVNDSVGGLLYIRLRGEGFRIFPFVAWDEIAPGASVWHHPFFERRGTWGAAVVDQAIRVADETVFPLWRPAYAYRVSGAPESSLLIDADGELAGFVGANGALIPSWLIMGQLSSVLSGKAIRYDVIPLRGQMVEAVTIGESVKFISGFLVTEIARSTPQIRRGDVIIRIGGEAVRHTDLSRLLLFAGDEFSVTVVRNGAEEELTVQKTRP